MTELLKCPFCGGKVELYETHERQFGIYHDIEENSGCPITSNALIGDWVYDTKKEAIEAWNTRKPVQDVLERLEEERQKMRDESDRFSTLYLDNFESNDPMKAVAESVIVCEQKSFAFGKAIEIVKEGLMND